MSTIEIPESGTVTVKVGGSSFNLDAYKTYNSLLTIRSRIADEEKPVEDFHQAACDYFVSVGLPTLNHFQADKLIAAFEKAVIALGEPQPGEGTPSLPGSMEPKSSPSQVA